MKYVTAFVLIACLACTPLYAAIQPRRGVQTRQLLTSEQVAHQMVDAIGKLPSPEALKSMPPNQLSAATRTWEHAFESLLGTSAETSLRLSMLIPLTGEFYVNGKFDQAKSSEIAARMKSLSTDILDKWQPAADWFDRGLDKIGLIWLMVWQPMFEGIVLKPELARRQLNRLRFLPEDPVSRFSMVSGVGKVQAAFALIKVDALFEDTVFQATVFGNAFLYVEKIIHSTQPVAQTAPATEELSLGKRQADEESLRQAALDGDTMTVTKLLDRGVNIDAQDPFGSTALMLASFYGRTAVVRILVTRGANLGLRDSRGQTALDRARAGCQALAANVPDRSDSRFRECDVLLKLLVPNSRSR